MDESEKVREERQKLELKASDEAIEYLSCISEGDWNSILLSETLLTASSEKNFGEFEISLSLGEWNGKNCYVVHVKEESIVDTVPSVTNIIAHVDQTLMTLEQSIHEYTEISGKSLDKKTLMVLEDGEYTVQKTVTMKDFERKTHETYSLKQLQGFICEGCHVLLQRLLLRKGLPENLIFLAFDSEANLSKMTFQMLEEREIEVDDERVVTVGIECRLLSVLEPERMWQSFFLPDGHLITRTIVGINVTVQRSRLPRPPTPEEPPVIPPLNWEEDMQLFSQFTDRKEELIDDHHSYIRRHPELQAILADFLQFVLLRKPDDIFDFAKDFFGGMSLSQKNTDR